jgi:pullulanase
MSHRANRIVQAWLESPMRGVIELDHDWRARAVPVLRLTGGARLHSIERISTISWARESGYHFPGNGSVQFVFDPARHTGFDPTAETLHLACDLNDWTAAGDSRWAFSLQSLGGVEVWTLSVDAAPFLATEFVRFKFVTSRQRWLPVPADAPNLERDAQGNTNLVLHGERSGLHRLALELAEPADLSATHAVNWVGERHAGAAVPLRFGTFFHELHTDLPLGALPGRGGTVFRLFAPRARAVELAICAAPAEQDRPHRYALARRADAAGGQGVWEITLEGDLHGWCYWYHVDGPRDAFGHFDPRQRVLDPYALAALGRAGPGLVLDRARLPRAERVPGYRTPAWQDLVIVEGHVRDLIARAPLALSEAERLGFAGLTRWVEHPRYPLAPLGVNAVELQPLQEFDNAARADYHWGYMPVNWFAPASAYATQPEAASGIAELQALVTALHRRGQAVIVDVVYNHYGEPNHLLFIDKLYYFELGGDGVLANWSGCGNDYRATAAMAKRLIIDSCAHWLELFGVDGFRFDLADLIGAPVLREIETALKRVKPDVILIAEPWSFRGHIAGELTDTGWASWNDGYRNFLRDYVRGGGARETCEYFIKGSPWFYAKWPAQTVNYVESHDDRTWMDIITENPDGSGQAPTPHDRKRTHLMVAFLTMSVGIPMFSAGQDFMRSKQGVNNTYLRGDLNALDYGRMRRFPATHAYFAAWIAFRRSPRGALLRQFSRAGDGFFGFHWAEGSSACAVIYNADLTSGAVRLLFAINPTLAEVSFALPAEVAALPWRQLADHERFLPLDRPDGAAQPVEAQLALPALACGLWIAE